MQARSNLVNSGLAAGAALRAAREISRRNGIRVVAGGVLDDGFLLRRVGAVIESIGLKDLVESESIVEETVAAANDGFGLLAGIA
jgi:hypothetical protein